MEKEKLIEKLIKITDKTEKKELDGERKSNDVTEKQNRIIKAKMDKIIDDNDWIFKIS